MKQPHLAVLLLLFLCLWSVACGWDERPDFARFVELENQIRTMNEAADAVQEDARGVRQAAESARASWETTRRNHQQEIPQEVERALEKAVLAETASSTAKARVIAAEITAGWVREVWLSSPRPHYIAPPTSSEFLDRIQARLVQSQSAAHKALQHTETAVARAQTALLEAQTAVGTNTP